MLFRPKGSKNWHYDFQVGGRRFRGTTRTADRVLAKKIEAKRHGQAVESQEFPKLEEMALREAFGRFQTEVADHQASKKDVFYQLNNLIEFHGADTLLSELTTASESERIARRRGEVSDASTNRETQLLRRVINRARDVWEVATPRINWRALMLPEPEERTRELSKAEEKALLEALRPEFVPVVRFAILAGARLSNIIRLTWTDVDWDAEVIVLRQAKGGVTLHIPLSPAMASVLSGEKGKHPIYCFTYQCKRSRGGRQKGQRYPYSKNGWRADWKKALEAAGIEDFRFHDTRHTACTQVLRATGNLKLVQKVAGHKSIQTTLKYAHVLMADIRDGLVERERQENSQSQSQKHGRMRKSKGESGQ